MTVRELITQLQECSPDAQVTVNTDCVLEPAYLDAAADRVALSSEYGRWYAQEALGLTQTNLRSLLGRSEK